jgi:hypothetical protein
MISRRSFAYSSITRRASSKRDGLGFDVFLTGHRSSGWFMGRKFHVTEGDH